MANAIANHLQKKLLVVNFPSLGTKNMSELMRLIFREAKLYDAIIFFDECESLFESRNQSKSVDLTSLLTEIEHYDGLVVMPLIGIAFSEFQATNRPYDLDEAMYRRINLAIEFKLPDFNLRREIWRSHLPPDIAVAADVEWTKLAMNFELAGGFIKNAILSALTFAIARNGEDICIQQQDLEKGAKLQLRGHLQMVDFEQRVVPKKGVEDMVLNKQQQGCISDIISFEKARKVLFGHWGFETQMQQGTVVLFSGEHPGAGKRTAAEALGYEIGRAIKYVGGSIKNVDALFKEAKKMDAILVFDQASVLFSSSLPSSQHALNERNAVLYQINKFPGVVVLICDKVEDLDYSLFRRINFVLEFGLPEEETRERLWRRLMPDQVPLGDDVDLTLLAHRFHFTGGNIMNAIVRAAERASLRQGDGEQPRRIDMADLLQASEEEARHLAKVALPFYKTLYM